MNNITSEFRPGVLGKSQLLSLIDNNIIHYPDGKLDDVDLSAMDLHLSDKLWIMKGGVKGNRSSKYSEILQSTLYREENIENIQNGFELEPEHTYIVELQEKFAPQDDMNLYGYATGKSTIGRLDILTRLIADYSDYYDELPCPEIYKDLIDTPINLYVEITPITFKIKIQTGNCLNQLRLFSGPPRLSTLSRDDLEYYGKLLLSSSNPTEPKPNYSYLSVDLAPCDIGGGLEYSAFQAKRKDDINDTIDLSALNKSLDPALFWKPINWNTDSNTLEIKPDRFYIIRSKERLNIPLDIAVYIKAMTESLGELRIHYAGFAHPYFGNLRVEDDQIIGTPLTFEIRGHNVTTYLRNGERIARIKYHRVSEPYKLEGEELEKQKRDQYQLQELQLAKYFKKWEEE